MEKCFDLLNGASVQKQESGPTVPSRSDTEVCGCVCVCVCAREMLFWFTLFHNSSVKVQVAQVLRWFLRGTDFLIVKDYPPERSKEEQ